MELDDYQFKALKYILKNTPESVENNAVDNKLDPDAALGILTKVVSNENYLKDLSDKQSFIFNKTVMPLITKVKCDGMMGAPCIGDNYLNGESLVEAYMYSEFRCSECADTMNRHGF